MDEIAELMISKNIPDEIIMEIMVHVWGNDRWTVAFVKQTIKEASQRLKKNK